MASSTQSIVSDIEVAIGFVCFSKLDFCATGIQNFFLIRDLFEEVFMDIPHGYNIQRKHKQGQEKLMCKLHKRRVSGILSSLIPFFEVVSSNQDHIIVYSLADQGMSL